MSARLRLAWFVCLGITIAFDASAQRSLWDCERRGPSAEWILTSHPPVGSLEGHLGADVFLRMHALGIPVSFISRAAGDPYIRLQIGDKKTTREILDDILAQAPGYQLGVIEGRVVIYPKDERYDAQIYITPKNDVTRGAAIYPLLNELMAKSEALANLAPVLRGMGKSIYGYRVDVGGVRSVVEHMVSLMGNDPSISLRVVAKDNGYRAYILEWTPVIRKIYVHAPSTVAVGMKFQVEVTGKLADGATVSLAGKDCGVKYSIHYDRVVEVDESGHGLALKKGVGLISVDYEDQFADAEIRVE